jgi:trimeric autotransporter adhesin
MTTIKRTTVPTKVPGIPKPPAEISAGLRRYLENLSEAVEIRLGRRGDQRDRAITLRELIDSGLAVELVQRPFDPNAGSSTFTSNQPAVDTTILAAPTNFTATGAFSTIILFWDKSPYRNYSFTEIWRHDADIIGDAQLVAISSGISFVDPVGGGAAYYYWARHVSTAGIEGPFHDVNGEFVETAPDVGFLLDTLTDSITESQLYEDLGSRINLIDGDASLEGSVAYLLAQEAAARAAAIAQEAAARSAGITAEAVARAAEIAAASQALESLIDSFTFAQDYDNAVTYNVGNLAVYGNNLYRAIATTTGNLPTNTTYWELLGEYSSLIELVGENSAAIVQLNNVSATSTSANASALFGLQSTVNDSETGLLATRATLFNNYYTSADTDTAISNATTGLASTTYVTNALGNYVTNATLTTNYYTRTDTDSAISTATTNLVSNTSLTSTLGNYVTNATLINDYYTKTDTDSAISSATTNLVSNTDLTNALGSYATNATLTTNYYTRTDTDSAISSATTNLVSNTSLTSTLSNYATNATLINDYYTRTDTDSAISTATTNLVSNTSLTSTLSNYATNATLINNYYTRTDTDSAISTATTNLVSNTDLTNTLGSYATNATLINNYYTRTDTDSAISTATTGLASTTYVNTALGDYATNATLTNNYYTQTDTDSAISTAVSTLSSTVGNNTAAIQLAAQSINGLEAQYTVKIDNNGYVTGFGLASTLVNSTPFSEFIVRADRFAISSPGQVEVVPFVVTTSTTTLNGETVPAGVYIDQAYIKNGAISEAKIGTLSADKITSGFIRADIISANSINAEKLAISANVDGSASSIYMDSAGAIKVYDASGNPRVIIGNLSA